MNIIYIIFIIIILFSFITGLFVTVAENREKKKYKELLEEESIENEENISEIEDNSSYDDKDLIDDYVSVQNTDTNESNGVEFTPNIENPISNEDNSNNGVNNSKITNPLDNIEVLDNTIKLDFISTKNDKKHGYNKSPKLEPYSVVDDDII